MFHHITLCSLDVQHNTYLAKHVVPNIILQICLLAEIYLARLAGKLVGLATSRKSQIGIRGGPTTRTKPRRALGPHR